MNADPRRPEKVQRYVPKANNGTGTEDLTPDYMNILGQTTANVAEDKTADKHSEAPVNAEQNLQAPSTLEEAQRLLKDEVAVTTTATTNVIPTSPQYGVAIIPNANDAVSESNFPTPTTETSTDSTAKQPDENKDLHSTPNRNDRFKVVKIASLEPFKRGRWKCMDYVDEAPPAGTIRIPQSTGSIQIATGPYMQTQSLPQQQIQQMLLQGGFTNGTQFFASVPTQVLPQGQYFYPQVATGTAQNQSIPQQVPGGSMPTAQFIGNQQYFPVQNAAGFTVPQTFPNTVQYVPANLIPNQNSAFVPTSQTVQMPNFQQSQTYAGQANVSQANVIQPVVNGHSFTPQNELGTIGTLPTQNVKNVIMNASNNPQPVVSQAQIQQQQQQPNIPAQVQLQAAQSVPVIQNQQQFQQNYQPAMQNATQPVAAVVPVQIQTQQPQPNIVQTSQVPTQLQTQQSVDQTTANNVYTNPTFAMSVNSLTVLENNDNQTVSDITESGSGADAGGENPDDPAKTNPVVNAIDNKIEQAMDLVKSHLMYTVREEVEVLKEKIAELMERIQQLESENNFLRSQIPKSQAIPPPVGPTPTPTFIPAASNQNPAQMVNPHATAGTPVTNANSVAATVGQVQQQQPLQQQQQGMSGAGAAVTTEAVKPPQPQQQQQQQPQ